MEEERLRAQLVGALIGLARTCSNNPPTDQTEGLLLAGLHAADPQVRATEDQLRRLIDRVHADKAAVSPNCVNCAAPCGKNDDYDPARIETAPADVQTAKRSILNSLMTLAHKGRMSQLVYDSLFAMAEDWSAEALAWYVQELTLENQ